jgi:uncharacterized protein (TIGR03435 family)
MRGAIAFGLLALLAVAAARSQMVPRISIEPARSGTQSPAFFGRDRVIASNITLDRLIAHAFEVDPWKSEVPEWFKESRYEVRAAYEAPGGGGPMINPLQPPFKWPNSTPAPVSP